MKLNINSFLYIGIGVIFGSVVTYILKPQRAAISERSLTRMNEELMVGSYPQLQAASAQARLAMRLYPARNDEIRVRELSAEALATFLTVSEESKSRGDLAFMGSIIDSNLDAVARFLESYPELRKNEN